MPDCTNRYFFQGFFQRFILIPVSKVLIVNLFLYQIVLFDICLFKSMFMEMDVFFHIIVTAFSAYGDELNKLLDLF